MSHTILLTRFIEDRWFRAYMIILGWTIWAILRFVENWSIISNEDFDFSENLFKISLVALGWAISTPFMLWLVERQQNLAIWKILFQHISLASALIIFRAALNGAILSFIFDSPAPFTGNFYQLTSYFIANWWYGSYLHYGFIVSAYSALLWFNQYKKSELVRANLLLKSEMLERHLLDAKLTALRMQLNPHFLFNTLHSVATLVRIQDKTKAINMLSLLSNMLRYTVYEGTKNMVTAREEIDFIKGYLSIEEIRFHDRLRVHWNLEEEALECAIPNLLLQPIVENSLKHGLKQTHDGELGISLTRIEGTVCIEISDNGKGLPTGWTLESSKGVGLSNTWARLETIYHQDFQFIVASDSGQRGTRVKIIIPFKHLREND